MTAVSEFDEERVDALYTAVQRLIVDGEYVLGDSIVALLHSLASALSQANEPWCEARFAHLVEGAANDLLQLMLEYKDQPYLEAPNGRTNVQ